MQRVFIASKARLYPNCYKQCPGFMFYVCSTGKGFSLLQRQDYIPIVINNVLVSIKTLLKYAGNPNISTIPGIYLDHIHPSHTSERRPFDTPRNNTHIVLTFKLCKNFAML